jgi:hypothetical protein
MERGTVWEIISYAWTEIGIGDEECARIAEAGGLGFDDLRTVRRMYFRDVCASFAPLVFLIFPGMLWMLMPDWGYPIPWLRERMGRWYARPYWSHWLNPLRILGYPLALLSALSYLRMLHRVLRRCEPVANTTGAPGK